MKNNTFITILLAILALGLLLILGPVDQEPEHVSTKTECTWTKQTDGSEICK